MLEFARQRFLHVGFCSLRPISLRTICVLALRQLEEERLANVRMLNGTRVRTGSLRFVANTWLGCIVSESFIVASCRALGTVGIKVADAQENNELLITEKVFISREQLIWP